MAKSKSPLRYPGGKTRACKILDTILKEHFNLSQFENLVSPIFGGGSFEIHLQNQYDFNIIANDKFTPLYNFWNTCKTNKKRLCKRLTEQLNMVDKEEFTRLRKGIMEESDGFKQSIMFFVINRCSFSGATLSGGFSSDSSKNRFTESSIDNIKLLDLSSYQFFNLDFKKFINDNQDEKNLMFLDPPYYLNKGNTLYGNNGDLHEAFNHKRLYKCLSTKKNWIMTYNDCEYIRALYKGYKIIEVDWKYGMNATKKSSEIVIIGRSTHVEEIVGAMVKRVIQGAAA